MHAYLVMAHNDFYILEKLVQLIDDERNDIYLHIDKKVKEFPFEEYRTLVKKSRIFFVKRRNIQWGSFTMIKTELELYQAAAQVGYDYYHLLSGVDLPIKSQDEIHSFFDSYRGMEFIACHNSYEPRYNDRKHRFQYYHLFNDYGVMRRGIRRLNRILLDFQRVVGIDRYKDKYEYYFGANWASLTHQAVEILLSHRKVIHKRYSFSHCCDEVYKQTILMNEGVNLFKGENPIARLIVWGETDGDWHPKIFTINDYEQLHDSKNCMFARKFSTRVDKEIIDIIYEQVRGE